VAAPVAAPVAVAAQPIQPAHSVAPTSMELDAFKGHVNTYIDADNEMKKLKKTLNACNAAKKEASTTILEFMQKHNIDDLNTRHGTIRYKITKCKQPMSQASIKTKMVAVYNAGITVDDLVHKVFEERPTVERRTLRRLTNAAAGSTD
jgi:seryl-tRNA synthetase